MPQRWLRRREGGGSTTTIYPIFCTSPSSPPIVPPYKDNGNDNDNENYNENFSDIVLFLNTTILQSITKLLTIPIPQMELHKTMTFSITPLEKVDIQGGQY